MQRAAQLPSVLFLHPTGQHPHLLMQHPHPAQAVLPLLEAAPDRCFQTPRTIFGYLLTSWSTCVWDELVGGVGGPMLLCPFSP